MKHFSLIFSTIFFLFISLGISAQENKFVHSEDSDPKAISLITQTKENYESLKSMEINFKIEIEIPEEDLIVQKGIMAQKGDKFRLDMDDQSVISNGEILWFHLKKNNEVQINDASILDEEDDGFMTPDKLLKMYDNDEFIFYLSQEYTKGDVLYSEIECKPIDRDSDYSKMRLTLDKKNKKIQSVKAFSKDGSRYTFVSEKMIENKDFEDSHFLFDKSIFPDIYVEDLRQ